MAGPKRSEADDPALTPIVESLEDRILLSADLLATPPSPVDDLLVEQNPAAPLPVPQLSNTATELVFVDARVAEADILIDELQKQQRAGRPLEIFTIEENTEGLSQVGSILAQRTTSAVHIISHGSESGFHLGSSWVDAHFASEHQNTLQSWRDGLTDDADLMLYGCNLAASSEGQDLSILLAGLTGADVASSNNTTGHHHFGGDWQLEHHHGLIDTLSIGTNGLAQAWEHELLTGTNDIDILYGAVAQLNDAADFELIGNAGNDLLIASDDAMVISVPGIGDLHRGDFPYKFAFTPFLFYSEYGVTTNSAEIDVLSGAVDFIFNGDDDLTVPGGGRAIVMNDAVISSDFVNMVDGNTYTVACYMGGETAGYHEIEIDINGQTYRKSVTMPEGNTFANMDWQVEVYEHTHSGNSTNITVRVIEGSPVLAAMRVVDHTQSAGNFTLEDGAGYDVVIGGAGNDTINSGPGRDYLAGGLGNDTIHDGNGNDVVRGGGGADTIHDGPGSDIVYGGDGNDIIRIADSTLSDNNKFHGGAGNDNYLLPNHVKTNFTLENSSGTDKLILDHQAENGDRTFFLPDTFSFTGSNVSSIVSQDANFHTIGNSSYNNAVSWNLSELNSIEQGIAIQGGTGADIFGLAFTETEYRGGNDIDIARVYGNAADYTIDRTGFTGPNTSDDTQFIMINDGNKSDLLWDTVEYIDFDDSRYEIATGDSTDRPSTITNVGGIPSITVKNGVSTPLDLSVLEFEDSELQYAVENNTNYRFELETSSGTIKAIHDDGSEAGPKKLIWDPAISLESINEELNNTSRFQYLSNPGENHTTDTLTLIVTDPNKTSEGGAEATLAVIPITVNYDPVLDNVESATISYSENDPATALSTAITLSDPNTGPIKSATIQISNHAAGEDALAFSDTASIISSYDNTTGTLTLTGDDTVENYQSALRAVTYVNSSDDPDTTTRTLEFSVYDGQGHATPVSRDLNISEVNDNPQFSSVTNAFTDEDTSLSLTFTDLLSMSNASDVDGDITAFVVAEETAGKLTLGGDDFDAAQNNIIDEDNPLTWTPPTNQAGTIEAFDIVARDEDGDISGTVTVSVEVREINDIPTFVRFDSNIVTTNEDTPVVITFDTLLGASDAEDTEGEITGFAVQSVVANTTLTIGGSAYDAANNYIIDANNSAQWTPKLNANGLQRAFTALAIDDDNATSAGTAPMANILVNDINDKPTLALFDQTIVTTDEDTSVEITFDDIDTVGKADDIDGSISAFVVQGTPNATLLINGDEYNAVSNNTIDSANSATWTPPNNANGDLHAFDVRARDDDGGLSGTQGVPVEVNAINDTPTLSSISAVDTTDEDTQVEITYDELLSASDAADVDGDQIEFVVTSVINGALLINGNDVTASNKTIDQDAVLLWTPDENDHGTINGFRVVARDAAGAQSAVAEVPIQVNDINDLPTLGSFSNPLVTTDEDTGVEISFDALLAAGDQQDDDGTVTAFIVQSVPNGTLEIGGSPYNSVSNRSIDANNSATWLPESNTHGVQQAFTVRAQDDDGGVSGLTPAGVFISVTDVNDLPTLTVFSNAVGTTDEDTPIELSFASLRDNSDAGDVDGTVTAFIVQSVPENAELRIGGNLFDATSNNTIDETNSALYSPPANVNGRLSAFAVVAQDDDGDTSTAPAVSVPVEVNDINDAPTLTEFSRPVTTTDEDTAVEIGFSELLSASDATDIDGTISRFSVQTVLSGTIEPAGDKIIWTPDENANGELEAFTVLARDEDEASSSDPVTVSVLVNDINDAPELTTFTSVAQTTDEDVPVAITFEDIIDSSDASDTDGNITSFIVQSVPADAALQIGGAAFDPETNNTIDNDHAALWTPPLNDNGRLTAFTVAARDDDGDISAVTPVPVKVDAINDIPVFAAFSSHADTIDEDTRLDIEFEDLLALSDAEDVDGDVTAFIVQSEDNGTLYIDGDRFDSATNNAIADGNSVSWVPDANINGIHQAFTVVARDSDGAESALSSPLTVSIRDINDAPTLSHFSQPVSTTDEDTAAPISFTALEAAGNAEDIDGTVSAYVVQSVTSGSLSIGDRPYDAISNNTIDAANPASWTPDRHANGVLQAFTVRAEDDDGALSTAEPSAVSVTVNDVNDPPTLSSFVDNTGKTDEDTPISLTFEDIINSSDASDVDGDVTALVVQSVTAGATLQIDGRDFDPVSNNTIDDNHSVVWTPPADENGTLAAFTVVARDDDGGQSDSLAVPIEVRDINDPPTFSRFSGQGVASTPEDTTAPVSFSELLQASNAADIDGSITAFAVRSVTSGELEIGGSAYDAANNFIIDADHTAQWMPDEHAHGKLTAFTVVARDDDGAVSLAAPASVIVSVDEVNDLPYFNNTAPTTITLEDTEVSLGFEFLRSLTDAGDVDGSITAYEITEFTNGELSIGADENTAAPFSAGNNAFVDGTHSAYWRPGPNINTSVDDISGYLSIQAIDNDGDYASSAARLTIDILPVNDAPDGSDSTIELIEDHSHTITLSDIGFSDTADNHRLSGVIITELSDNGDLQIDGISLAVNATVTADQISSGALSFIPNAHINGAVKGFAFAVQDDGGTPNGGTDIDPGANTIAFDIAAVNDAPQLEIGSIALDEGSEIKFDSSHLAALDVDDTSEELTYTITSLPAHGELFIDGQAISVGARFTQADIDNGLFSYLHNASETHTDQFSVEVADGGEDDADTASADVMLDIAEVIDQAPTISDKDIALEFAEPLDTAEQPEASLLHQVDSKFSVEIIEAPAHGTVELQPDGNFTYVHDGSLVLQDKFIYRVTNEDGVASEATVHINIEPPLASAFAAQEGATETEVVSQETAKGETVSAEPVQEQIQQQPPEFSLLEPDTSAAASTAADTPDFAPQVLELALSEENSRRPTDYSDEVIQHRQLREDRIRIVDDNKSLLLEAQLNNAALSSLFEVNYEKSGGRQSSMAERFDEQRDLLRDKTPTNFEIGSRAVTLSSGLSIGYLLWLVRGGVLPRQCHVFTTRLAHSRSAAGTRQSAG